VRVAH